MSLPVSGSITDGDSLVISLTSLIRLSPEALDMSVDAPPYLPLPLSWYFLRSSSIPKSFSDCLQSRLCFSASITTIECLTARSISSMSAPLMVISVMRLETFPIWVCFWKPLRLTSREVADLYDSFGSNSIRSLRAFSTLMFCPFVGITRTVSPSKSAPESCSATLWLIPTASLEFGVIVSRPSLFLLFTISLGISNFPPWGYLTRTTSSPSL